MRVSLVGQRQVDTVRFSQILSLDLTILSLLSYRYDTNVLLYTAKSIFIYICILHYAVYCGQMHLHMKGRSTVPHTTL